MLGVKLEDERFGDNDGWEELLMECPLCGLEMEGSLEVADGLRPRLLVLLWDRNDLLNGIADGGCLVKRLVVERSLSSICRDSLGQG